MSDNYNFSFYTYALKPRRFFGFCNKLLLKQLDRRKTKKHVFVNKRYFRIFETFRDLEINFN